MLSAVPYGVPAAMAAAAQQQQASTGNPNSRDAFQNYLATYDRGARGSAAPKDKMSKLDLKYVFEEGLDRGLTKSESATDVLNYFDSIRNQTRYGDKARNYLKKLRGFVDEEDFQGGGGGNQGVGGGGQPFVDPNLTNPYNDPNYPARTANYGVPYGFPSFRANYGMPDRVALSNATIQDYTPDMMTGGGMPAYDVLQGEPDQMVSIPPFADGGNQFLEGILGGMLSSLPIPRGNLDSVQTGAATSLQDAVASAPIIPLF